MKQGMRVNFIKGIRYLLPSIQIICGILMSSLLWNCHRGFDSRLSDVDSMMKDHPDSALMILNSYSLANAASDADRAYYIMLQTDARYKNFIDEINDSLISFSTDYFMEHGDKELASRALFLQGVIRMNANRLGEAAVSFSKGIDIASEAKSYMWEGRNCGGLVLIYGRLMNGSEQLRYAKMGYDAFVKGGYQDWADYAKLDILRGYNNIGQYGRALADADSLIAAAKEKNDTILLEEGLTLRGTCKYSLSDFRGSVDDYLAAYQLDPSVITPNHLHNLNVSLSEIHRDSLPDGIQTLMEAIKIRQEIIPPFRSLAKEGRFKEAYEGLEIYKEMQDSVLKSLVQNSVSESIVQYEAMKKTRLIEKQNMERMLWAITLLALLVISLVVVWGYKNHLHKRELERDRLEDSLEILRLNLASQMKSLDEMEVANRVISEKCELMSSYLRDSLMEKYSKANELCDLYYQDRLMKSRSSVLEKEIKALLGHLSDPEFIKEIGTHIDKCADGLYSSFNIDFPNVGDDARRLFVFLTVGFSPRSICVIFGIEPSNLYNRKSRLKRMLTSSEAERKEEYIKSISR